MVSGFCYFVCRAAEITETYSVLQCFLVLFFLQFPFLIKHSLFGFAFRYLCFSGNVTSCSSFSSCFHIAQQFSECYTVAFSCLKSGFFLYSLFFLGHLFAKAYGRALEPECRRMFLHFLMALQFGWAQIFRKIEEEPHACTQDTCIPRNVLCVLSCQQSCAREDQVLVL